MPGAARRLRTGSRACWRGGLSRSLAEVIHHATWLYHVFSLSLRDIELILAERGLVVSYESIRFWCLRFGVDLAAKLRKRRPRPGDTWHLDEVYLKINGELFYRNYPPPLRGSGLADSILACSGTSLSTEARRS